MYYINTTPNPKRHSQRNCYFRANNYNPNRRPKKNMRNPTSTLLTLLLTLTLFACQKPELPNRKADTPIPPTTTGPIDAKAPDGMHGEWIYSGKILNMAPFRESEQPAELRANGFWANVRQTPLDITRWPNPTLQARYQLVFTQYESQPGLANATIRITADSLTVPSWFTAHYSDPTRMRALERVHLAKDSTLEFYLGSGQLMLIKWADSILLSTHHSEENAYTHDVWTPRQATTHQ